MLFKVGDIVKSKHSGNILEVTEDQTIQTRFSGKIIEHCGPSHHLGYEARDWARSMFELVQSHKGFWQIEEE
ncbi:MAG: hypothetical protein ACRCX7_11510 [Cetobacterium sp.]|uniref:hypothetical protein n=1 Tax=Cetobacterium sp. TaxID=2071632 RepID=UPI003F39B521